jgi:hypothetical protein
LEELDNLEFFDGVLLPSGHLITCGYQEHNYVYPILSEMGLTKASDWTHCDESFHISSRQLSGTVAHHFEHPWREGINITDEQLHSLYKLRHQLSGIYGGDNRSITEMLIRYVGYLEKHGGKWNNLKFLEKFYKHRIKLPKFSKSPVENVKNCLRTSPKYSLPGLLESKFDLTENSVQELEQTFEKFKDIRSGNQLHYFYQEFLEGANGVFHIDQNGFRYDISEKRGDIVQGKSGNLTIFETTKRRLHKLAEMLYKDIDAPLQVEFVVNEDEVFVVQLRLLENNPERTVIVHKPENFMVDGKTFSHGTVENLDVNDILVLDEDGDSELLLGKKALIVKRNVEFSHILALSKALRIPSFYAVEKFELPTSGKVNFKAYGPEAWITKAE